MISAAPAQFRNTRSSSNRYAEQRNSTPTPSKKIHTVKPSPLHLAPSLLAANHFMVGMVVCSFTVSFSFQLLVTVFHCE